MLKTKKEIERKQAAKEKLKTEKKEETKSKK